MPRPSFAPFAPFAPLLRFAAVLRHAGVFPLATLLVLAVASPAHAQQPVIGLITKTANNPFFVKMKEGAEGAAKAAGARLLSGAGKSDGDNAGQVTAMENMIAAGAQVILITVSDAKAIVPSIRKARARGILVIALDSPTDPQDATDAFFGTDNYRAGLLIGQYARAALGKRPARIVTLDLLPGHPVGAQRHNGFLKGFGLPAPEARVNTLGKPPEVACMADSYGDQTRGQTAMENCLQRVPDVSVVYAINEPSAAGAARALKAAGKERQVILVTVDGGCQGVRDVERGAIAATSQQYPVRMAELGVKAAVAFVKSGTRPSGYTDTGVALVAAKPMAGVPSVDVAAGLAQCFGSK